MPARDGHNDIATTTCSAIVRAARAVANHDLHAEANLADGDALLRFLEQILHRNNLYILPRNMKRKTADLLVLPQHIRWPRSGIRDRAGLVGCQCLAERLGVLRDDDDLQITRIANTS